MSERKDPAVPGLSGATEARGSGAREGGASQGSRGERGTLSERKDPAVPGLSGATEARGRGTL
jgi:hypothetical protein